MNNTLEKVRNFAIEAHGKQKYGKYGKYPYVYHLDAVVKILDSYNYGHSMQVIGYLHDVLEDTKVTKKMLEKQFGKYFAECVAWVTDEPGHNRKTRKRKTNEKFKHTLPEFEIVLVVKAADRLANLIACVDNDQQSLLSMYKAEHEEFKKAVYREDLCDDIWELIETIIN